MPTEQRSATLWLWTAVSVTAIWFVLVAFPLDRPLARALPAGVLGHVGAIVLPNVLLCAPVFVFGFFGRRWTAWISYFRPPEIRWPLLLTVLGLSAIAAAYMLHFGRLNASSASRVLSLFENGSVGYLIIAAFPEEFLFRVVALREFSAVYGTLVGIIASAGFFVLAHLPRALAFHIGPRAAVMYLGANFCVGTLLALSVNQARSAWPAVILHAVYNVGLQA